MVVISARANGLRMVTLVLGRSILLVSGNERQIGWIALAGVLLGALITGVFGLLVDGAKKPPRRRPTPAGTRLKSGAQRD